MWKKFFILFFVLMSFSFSCYSEDIIVDVVINGNFADFDLSYAHIINNKTYIPLRKISEILNKDVTWDYTNQSAEVEDVIFYKDKNYYAKNLKTYYLNDCPVIKDNTLYVGARDFFDIFDIDFSWDQEYYCINIDNENINLLPSQIKYDYTNDHIYWLSRIINAESEGETLLGKIAVGNVILNRVKSDEFPNTIYTVIFDTKYAVQYEPVINKTIYNTPSYESIKAAKLSLNGFNVVADCLYFFNPKTASSSWIKNNRTFYTSIGNHDFYL